MRILHITDSHGTVKTPDSRTDLYYITFLKKFMELKYVIKLYHIDMIIHTGDLFHTSRVSNKFMGQLAEIINSYGIPMYVVPGNHDIDGYTIDTIDQTSLGLLAKTNVVKLLTRDTPFAIESKTGNDKFTIAISGQEYYSDIDTGNMDDFDMQQPEADFNILATHDYIADTPQHPNIRCTYPKDIITNADVILTGHYHRQFEIDMQDFGIYNPGSMLRVERTDYNKTHMPQYGVLDVSLDNSGCVVYDYQFHNFRIAKPGNEVFDFGAGVAVKQYGITLGNFKNSIANSIQSIQTGPATSQTAILTQMVSDYVSQNNIDVTHQHRLDCFVQSLHSEASKQVLDEDVINVKGFIPSNTEITLESIEMFNFMSHEHTEIHLSSGLNVIIGESNSGKTTILRLMRWVIDNEPLGTDFIMTGKDWCKGILKFSNGTIIERYRTLKDTGYYKVTYFDDIQGQFVTNEFKGFTNNVPVEVINAHQMPKIAITKNIETHLNMMTQLEKPFLITDNTNEKAAAIGRITGTNIIDTAIKNNTSDIASDKKMLTQYLKDKASSKSELNAIPINAIIKLRDLLVKLSDDMNQLSKEKSVYEELMERSSLIDGLITKEEQSIKTYTDIISGKAIIDSAQLKSADITQLLGIKKNYMRTEEQIAICNNDIKHCKDIIKNKDDIVLLKKQVEEIQMLINLKNKSDALNSTMVSCQKKITVLNNTVSSKNKIEYQKQQIADINSLLVLYKNVSSIDKDVAVMEDDVKNQKSLIKNLKKTVTIQTNELKQFVLSAGKCPCCGQDITEENVTSIINNFSMEGK